MLIVVYLHERLVLQDCAFLFKRFDLKQIHKIWQQQTTSISLFSFYFDGFIDRSSNPLNFLSWGAVTDWNDGDLFSLLLTYRPSTESKSMVEGYIRIWMKREEEEGSTLPLLVMELYIVSLCSFSRTLKQAHSIVSYNCNCSCSDLLYSIRLRVH